MTQPLPLLQQLNRQRLVLRTQSLEMPMVLFASFPFFTKALSTMNVLEETTKDSGAQLLLIMTLRNVGVSVQVNKNISLNNKLTEFG